MGRHTEWRKVAKKCRRSRIRRLKAQERDTLLKEEELKNLKSSVYLTWKKDQEALELFARVEEERIQKEENRKWIEREQQAQQEWKESQEKISLFKAEKAKQDLLIREEWDREQKKIKEIEEKNRQEKEEREQQETEFKKRVEDFIAGVSEELPEGFRINIETRPDKELCPFFVKVGACRFYDNCSRNHVKPAVSKTLLLNNFFSHMTMDNKSVRQYDTDMILEYDDKEMYKHFLDFYDDTMPELRLFGKVTQFKVCCNLSPHLRGNVYVSYSTERESLKAYYALMGRFYGGRQIRGQFIKVPLWSKALCGLFLRNKCPKGGTCNFLHVFRNPTSEFVQADMDYEDYKQDQSCSRSTGNSSSKRHSTSWAWSSDDDSSEEDRENENKNNRKQRNRQQRSRERSSIRRIENNSDRKNKRDRSKDRSSRSNRDRSCSRSKIDRSSRSSREMSSRSQTYYYDSDKYTKRDSRINDSNNSKDRDKKRQTIDRNCKQRNSEDDNKDERVKEKDTKDERVKEIDPKDENVKDTVRSKEKSKTNCDQNNRLSNKHKKKRSKKDKSRNDDNDGLENKNRPRNDEYDLKIKDSSRSRNDKDSPKNKDRSKNDEIDEGQNCLNSDNDEEEESSFEYKKRKHKSKEVG